MEDCKFPLFIPYLDCERKSKNMFIQGLNNKFGNILLKIRLFFLHFFSNGRLKEAGILPRIVNENSIFSVQIGGGCLSEHGRLVEILRYLAVD